ncbi:trypsin-like serine protease [candidate division KSB1 bacterium]|nr:trypsin-like serine protease [candidate division KSB1 bacterium]
MLKRFLAPFIFFVIGGVFGIFLLTKLQPGDESPLFLTGIGSDSTAVDIAPPIKEAAIHQVTLSRENAITRAVSKVSPAVVGINVTQIKQFRARGPFSDDPFLQFFFPELQRQRLVKGLGSGFIISPDGYIVTNEHVVHDASEIIVTLPDKTRYEAEIVAADYISDIALLKISGRRKFPFTILGNSDDLMIGEWSIAIGNPFGLFEIGAHPSVTIGIISALDRDFGKQDNQRIYQDMIQTDASINGGNSGGPLVNSLGEVIGVNTFIYSGSETMTASIGLGFALPINRVKKIVRDLKEHGAVNRSFWTGLEVEDLNPLIARYLGKKDRMGVIISNIEPNSPAEKANLQVGDIIVEVNDNKIRNTRDIWSVIENMDIKGGDELKLKIFRDQKLITVRIRLEKLPG